MSTMTVSEARAALPEILDRVLAGEEVTITRHGKPVAVVVRPDNLRLRRAAEALVAAEKVGAILEHGRQEPLRARPMLSRERADTLATEVRADRSGR